MLGIDHDAIRDRLDQGLGVIMRLFKGEVVTEETNWYCLRDARLQVLPSRGRTWKSRSQRLARVRPPHGGKAWREPAVDRSNHEKRRRGLALDLGYLRPSCGTTRKDGRSARLAAGRPCPCGRDAREGARERAFGLQSWLNYFTKVGTLPLGISGDGDIDIEIDTLVDSGVAVIGTPDDMIAQIERLAAKSGGFGGFLSMSHDWADFIETKRSYELIARYVMPRFRDQVAARTAANIWAKENTPSFPNSGKRRQPRPAQTDYEGRGQT